MQAPKLEKNKCSVLTVQYASGVVVKNDRTIFQKGDDENKVYQVFDNFIEAKNFIANFIRLEPLLECSIFNDKGEYLSTYNINGEE